MSIPVPQDVREHLDDYLEVRRLAEPALRWSEAERWHITLAFLPDVAEVDLDDLCERLGVACAKRRPLSLALGGGGVFGGPMTSRVLWADVPASDEDRAELDRLARGVRNAAAAAGTVVEGGRFVPHVTVARSPAPRDLRHLLDILELYHGSAWEARSVDLVASHVGAGPVRHEVVDTFTLGEPDESEEHGWWRRGFLNR